MSSTASCNPATICLSHSRSRIHPLKEMLRMSKRVNLRPLHVKQRLYHRLHHRPRLRLRLRMDTRQTLLLRMAQHRGPCWLHPSSRNHCRNTIPSLRRLSKPKVLFHTKQISVLLSLNSQPELEIASSFPKTVFSNIYLVAPR